MLRFVFLIAFSIYPLVAQNLTHGPIVGGVTSSSARFYVRVDTSASVTIQLSTSPFFLPRVITGAPIMTEAANDFAALILIDHLEANERYYYRAVINGQPVGEVPPRQFQTFPPEGTRESFMFTFGSCQQVQPWQNSPDAGQIFHAMLIDQPRFFLQIGDWGYPDTTDTEADPLNFFSVSMARVQESYRAKYAPDYPLQDLLRIAPVDYVYDDHDYVNNNSSAFSSNNIPEMKEVPLPPQARENSIRGYQQLFPGYPLPKPEGGLWHKFTYGNADFFVLDLRSQRSSNMEALRLNTDTNQYEFRPLPGHSILAGDPTLSGENQRDWLLRELGASQADWKFIVSPVAFNRGFRIPLDLALAIQDSLLSFTLPEPINEIIQIAAMHIALGIIDLWAGFPEDQEKLLDFLHNNSIKNVIVLSGDSHTAAIDDGTNAGLPELMAGSLDHSNSFLIALMELLGIDIWNRGGQNLQSKNFLDAYGRVTVFGADSVHLEIVDELQQVVARYTVLKDVSTGIPDNNLTDKKWHFALRKGYPNPIRIGAAQPHIVFRYTLPAPAQIIVTIYDILGRPVYHWQNRQPAGKQIFSWDGKNDRGKQLPSGIYILLMKLDFENGQQQIATQKITLIK